MNPLDNTLLEQLGFTELDIDERKRLFGIDGACERNLRSCRETIAEHLDEIVGEFYEFVVSFEENALLIADADTLGRLRLTQRRYILELFSGSYDNDYVNDRLHIGLVHKRIGVTPELYLSAVNAMLDLLQNRLGACAKEDHRRDQLLKDVERIVFFDVSLVFDMYIASFVSEVEMERKKAERYARSLEKQVKERTMELEIAANSDQLTSLLNRRAYDVAIRRELARSKRVGQSFALIFIDIDDFKLVNDREGHVKGDEVLRKIGGIILQLVRETDCAFRMGGDEFCVLLVDTGARGAERFCERLGAEFRTFYPEYSISMGISVADPDVATSSEELMAEADSKMYRAKQATSSSAAARWQSDGQ